MRALAGSLLVLAISAAWAAPAPAQRPLPALAPAANDGLTRALVDGRLTEAQYALERARSLFRLGGVRREFGDVERPGGRAATVLLRDLAVRLRELSGAERAQAERLLARPDDGDTPAGAPNGWGAVDEAPGSPTCDANLCIHWVASGPDRPPDADQVDRTFEIFREVWAEEVDTGGYSEPLDDGEKGGDGRFDVYLDNLGRGLFGYCAPDTDYLNDHPSDFAVPVYCVVDNDYSAAQYGEPPELDAFLKATAAHEFFHAVQGAYDFFEDLWLLEGTATNMEETVYPTIDDNLAFLRYSPLTKPASPLDRGGFGDSEYGSWIFWRYLEEKAYGGNPQVIRRIWQRAAAANPISDPDDHSLQAVFRVLRADGKHLADEFLAFGVANRRRAYADGHLYPAPPLHGTFRIGPTRRSTGSVSRRLNHLTTRYFRFRSGASVSPSARLRVNVKVHRQGGRARLVVYYKNGSVKVRRFTYTRSGFGSRRVPFGRGVVRRVDLVLSNGSSRTRCWRDFFNPPFYSCLGIPKDDRRTFSFRAILRHQG